jgi:hypothetical protein
VRGKPQPATLGDHRYTANAIDVQLTLYEKSRRRGRLGGISPEAFESTLK